MWSVAKVMDGEHVAELQANHWTSASKYRYGMYLCDGALKVVSI